MDSPWQLFDKKKPITFDLTEMERKKDISSA